VDLELARQQWQEGNRRLEESRGDRAVLAQLDVVTAELRARVGQTFTLQELADVYAGADRWVREALEDARTEDAPPPDAATVADAAFHLYARGATDYVP
jgi:hypothetical protein